VGLCRTKLSRSVIENERVYKQIFADQELLDGLHAVVFLHSEPCAAAANRNAHQLLSQSDAYRHLLQVRGSGSLACVPESERSFLAYGLSAAWTYCTMERRIEESNAAAEAFASFSKAKEDG